MKQIFFATLIFALVLGVSLWNPTVLLAGEHGGKEHAGEEQAGKEHGGAQLESHAATIREAADALRATNPDLAARLDQIAAQEESE
ncbi:MAG: hypothetical protein HY584_01745 [Candidatus Omnitrophica bacterium]|nr:hypothetical protein [Candidatus Omnitrophota bacterium]